MSDVFRVGCDIGGTFTDFVLLNTATGAVHTAKRLTTPADPARAMLAGLAELSNAVPGYARSTERLAHATTLVANTIIERKGSKTALLCTAGFRDVIELRRYVRVTTYELFADPPTPLVPRYLRLPVDERTRADGSVLKPVDSEEIARIAAQLQAQDVETIAICFLHSFSNPANERAAAEVLAKLLPGVALSLSSDVLAQIKEFERSSTTLINAYVKPLTIGYLGRLSAGIEQAGFRAPLQIMLSNGGIGSAGLAADMPVRLVESGPVAGAVVAQRLAQLLDVPEILAYDMGGTTAKACLIRDGTLPLTDELEVARSRRFTKSSGFPVAIPAVNMIEIGAGGGSIARINALGIVEVGPQSAAADPGPACYGLGGEQPTVSDADLVLGYLNADNFAGGTMRLDRQAAEHAITAHIGTPLGIDAQEAAWIIHDVVNESMAAAIRMHVSERGGDVSRPLLTAFGGAGPVHVCNLAAKLGIRRLLIPQQAGVLSALGLVLAPAAFDIARTRKTALAALSFADLAREIAAMREEISAKIAEVDATEPRFDVALGLGYVGQSYHVPVSVNPDAVAALTAKEVLESFATTYRTKYGYYYDDVPVELVNVHVTGTAGGDVKVLVELSASTEVASTGARGQRSAYSAGRRQFMPFDVYSRALLRRGMTFAGPCLIEEDAATTVVDAGARVAVDRYGSLDISLGAE
ncbi:MAG: hydantoinase/oxoprolinase family protein [Hyphomicrobiaceae bacterium]